VSFIAIITQNWKNLGFLRNFCLFLKVFKVLWLLTGLLNFIFYKAILGVA